jgi:SAM-dependent methyltransferase
MKTAALNVYVCPSCKGGLRLTPDRWEGREVMEGTLSCISCPASYPVRRGVPRFVESGDYASTFGRQWNYFRTVQIDSVNRNDRSLQMLRETTGWGEEALNGKLLLDAGVGAGRFADCANTMGARVFGIDLTIAIDAAFLNIGRREQVHLAQADIFALPFREETFDMAYSIGVLHHTPDPATAFARVAATVKPAGQFAVYLYSRYGIGSRLADLIRKVTTRLPHRVMLGLSAVAVPAYFVYKVPILGKLLRLVLPISEIPDWRWRWLDTFDWFTPKYQFKFLYPEVFRLFRENHFRDVEIFDGPIRMRGVKAAEVSQHESDDLCRMVAS